MKRILCSAVLMLAAAALLFGGCSGADDNGQAAVTAPAVPTPTPEPTVVPALLALGKGGVLEDEHVRIKLPDYLEYDSSPAYNCAYYTSVSDDGVNLVFAYLPDTSTRYDKEIGCLKREDYAKQVFNSSGADLAEFKFVEVAGRSALRTLTVYQNSSGAFSRTLTYFIDVDGWLLTLSYSTNAPELPEACERGILDMTIKG